MAQQTDREKRVAERREQLKKRMPHVKVVRVEPATDIMRQFLKHPRGQAFQSEGSAEWPLDRFTHRRIADGSVKLMEKDKDHVSHKDAGEAPKHDPAQRSRSTTPGGAAA